MKTISNMEIAKKICENEKIASCYTFSEILYIVDLCKSIEKKFKECKKMKKRYSLQTKTVKIFTSIILAISDGF